MSRAALINYIYTTATSPTATNALANAGPIIMNIPPISWLRCLNARRVQRCLLSVCLCVCVLCVCMSACVHVCKCACVFAPVLSGRCQSVF